MYYCVKMVYKAKVVHRTVRNGDTQVLRRFAWLPFRINDDIAWLETYEIYQQYEIKIYQVGEKGYQVGNWINISYRLIPKVSITVNEQPK